MMGALRIPVLLLGAGILLNGQDPAPSPVAVPVTADADAVLAIDGRPQGKLAANVTRQVMLVPGEHEFRIASPGGGEPFVRKVLVSSSLPTSVSVPLQRHLLRAQILASGYWRDAKTGFHWPAQDNGFGVTRSQARAFCAELKLAGFADWRLPEIQELQTLFGGAADERGVRVLAPIKITGWAWSNTGGNEPEENWAIDFADGARASVVSGDAGPNRALCVR